MAAYPTERPPQDTPLHIAFGSSPLQVRDALKRTLAGLGPLALSAEECGTVELVLAEVMNNIVEHAYQEAPDGMIDLHVSAVPTGLSFVFLDDGAPMPDGHPPLKTLPPITAEVDDLPEGGFGWFLIRELAHDLEYRIEAGRNRFSFRMSVGLTLHQA